MSRSEGLELDCRVPMLNTYGEVYATRSAGPHDWRLLSRERTYKNETHHQEGAPGYGTVEITPIGWREVWYCTRCRLVDEREVQS